MNVFNIDGGAVLCYFYYKLVFMRCCELGEVFFDTVVLD